MYTVKFNVEGHLARTLGPGCIGEHDGWVITGEIYKDYYEWVNEFEAHKIGTDEFVKGDFETEVIASSKEAYDEFVSKFPPDDWDYWDI